MFSPASSAFVCSLPSCSALIVNDTGRYKRPLLYSRLGFIGLYLVHQSTFVLSYRKPLVFLQCPHSRWYAVCHLDIQTCCISYTVAILRWTEALLFGTLRSGVYRCGCGSRMALGWDRLVLTLWDRLVLTLCVGSNTKSVHTATFFRLDDFLHL